MAKKSGSGLFFFFIILLIGYLYTQGKLQIGTGGVTTTPIIRTGFGQLVNLYLQGISKYTGSAVNVTAELYDSNNNGLVGETIIGSSLANISDDLPNSFNGYVIMGRDNYVHSTGYKEGDNYFITKYPVSWDNKQGIVSFDEIYVYAEETSTGTNLWTFYDDNTAESTANITIGSGGTYTAASVKIKSSSNNCTGNPSLNGYNGKKALGFCFNESTSGQFKEVKPKKNSGEFTVPGWLSGKNVIGCYYVTDAVCDGNYFITDLYFEAKSGQNPSITAYTNETHTFTNNTAYTMVEKPIYTIQRVGNTTTNWPSTLYSNTETTVTILSNATYNITWTGGMMNVSYTTHDYMHIIPVDLCWYKDDNLKWAVGFGDESNLASDTDCGMDSSAQALKVWLA